MRFLNYCVLLTLYLLVLEIGEFQFLHQEDAHEFNISLLGKMQQSALKNLERYTHALLLFHIVMEGGIVMFMHS